MLNTSLSTGEHLRFPEPTRICVKHERAGGTDPQVLQVLIREALGTPQGVPTPINVVVPDVGSQEAVSAPVEPALVPVEVIPPVEVKAKEPRPATGKCDHCGKWFSRRAGGKVQRWCSKECRHASTRKLAKVGEKIMTGNQELRAAHKRIAELEARLATADEDWKREAERATAATLRADEAEEKVRALAGELAHQRTVAAAFKMTRRELEYRFEAFEAFSACRLWREDDVRGTHPLLRDIPEDLVDAVDLALRTILEDVAFGGLADEPSLVKVGA